MGDTRRRNLKEDPKPKHVLVIGSDAESRHEYYAGQLFKFVAFTLTAVAAPAKILALASLKIAASNYAFLHLAWFGANFLSGGIGYVAIAAFSLIWAMGVAGQAKGSVYAHKDKHQRNSRVVFSEKTGSFSRKFGYYATFGLC